MLGSDPVVQEVKLTERDEFARYNEELVGFYQTMQRLNSMDLTTVFESLSAWTARASEIRNRIVSSDSRRSNTFRTRQLDPFIDECDRQFKYLSRKQSTYEMDAKLAGGRFT